MKKLLKYSLYGIASLIVLILVGVAIFAATFNPNDYKQKVVDLVKEKKQRTLNIEGDIKLSFWPKIGADLGKVSLSEHNNPAEFASLDSVKVSLALLPLLKKQLVVDTVYIDGAKANIIKYKDGTTNFDDLISKDESSNDIQFDIDGVNVSNSTFSYLDEASNAKYSISQLNLKTGHVALAEPIDLKTDFLVTANQPLINAKVNLKGNFLADSKAKHYAAKGLDATVEGDLAGGKNVNIAISGDVDANPEKAELLVDGLKLVATGDFSGAKLALDLAAPKLTIQKDEVSGETAELSITQEKAGDRMKVNLTLADIKGSPKALQSSGVSVDISGNQGKRTIEGKFSSPFSGDLVGMIFDLPKLTGNLDIKDPTLPNGKVAGTFALSLHTDIKKELANSAFNLNLDDTKLNGNVAVTGFKTPNIKFNINADRLDLNKLMGANNKAEPAKAGNKKPADLSFLKNILLDGKINIGSIIYDKYRIANLNVGVTANGEKLSLSGLNVKLDDSQIKGNFYISQFANPLYTFDLNIDSLDIDRYIASLPPSAKDDKKQSDKPLDLSALKALNANGSLRIGTLKYGKTKATNITVNLKADGAKLSLNPVSAKIDDSQFSANLGITEFSNPHYSFNVNIDKLDADKYITQSNQPAAKSTGDTPIDLSALKKLNASGEAKIGWLKLANVKTQNVNIGLKADSGLVTVSPFLANLYQGSMSGILKVDARTTPSITFKQEMKGIAIGPLLIDAINNDMLDGKGAVSIDITTSGNSVGALKKALAGKAALNLADGAVKGVDIAGQIRELKSKIAVFKAKDIAADKTKKTDFSELAATFDIKNGVAHNEDLAMKAPILRLAKGDSKGDIDIGNEKINYIAKPTVVKSLKGQGGADLDSLAGFAIPVKISGTFSDPKYGLDFSGLVAALAQSKLLDKVAGDKADAAKSLLNGSPKDALSDLLGKKNKATEAAPAADTTTPAGTGAATPAPAEPAKSLEDQAKDKAALKFKELFKF